jgi:hypothetical protein
VIVLVDDGFRRVPAEQLLRRQFHASRDHQLP